MTREKIFGALVVLAIAIAGIVFLPRSQGQTKTFNSQIEAVGLAKHGLEVIPPNHPKFSKLMTAKKPGPVAPFSVLVVNNSDRAVTSCTLKWEVVSPDGQTTIQFRTKVDPIETIYEGGIAHLNEGIAAKGNLLFSLTEISSRDNPSRTGTGFSMGGGGSNITAKLSASVKVAVSIDGVLFADGLYVGPDANNYFELFRGQVEADRDLASEIDRLVNDGATPETIANHLRKAAHTQSDEVQIPAGEDPQYSFGKWMQRRSYAAVLLLMREKNGDQPILDRVRAELRKPEIKLRKVKED